MKHLFLILALFTSLTVHCQDVIVKRDGSTILSKVLEVNTADIKYKKFSNQNGPTYSLEKIEVLSINYENGEKDVFIVTDTKTSIPPASVEADNSNKHQLVDKVADARNAEIIASYCHECHSSGKWNESSDPAKCGYVVYWVSPSSIMSNDEIEMYFLKQKWEESWVYYNIVLKNKTNKFIYVDLANCFRTSSTGEVRCYFDAEQTTISQGSSSGGSVGLGAVAGALGVGGTVGQLAGGVAVGGGTTGSVSTTYSQQRLISIPPYGQRNLSDFKRVQVKGSNYKTVSEAEDFDLLKVGLKGKIHAGEVSFDETNSPFTISYLITYSTNDNFSTYSTLTSKLYLKTIVGSKYSIQHIKMAGWSLSHRTKMEKYILGVKENTLLGIKFDEFN